MYTISEIIPDYHGCPALVNTFSVEELDEIYDLKFIDDWHDTRGFKCIEIERDSDIHYTITAVVQKSGEHLEERYPIAFMEKWDG